MRPTTHVAYLGFVARRRVREYSFLVQRNAEEPREFTLAIPNEAFLWHRARYQDAPDICAQRLHRELASSPDGPLERDYTITDAELEAYRVAHAPPSKPPRMPKERRAN